MWDHIAKGFCRLTGLDVEASQRNGHSGIDWMFNLSDTGLHD